MLQIFSGEYHESAKQRRREGGKERESLGELKVGFQFQRVMLALRCVALKTRAAGTTSVEWRGMFVFWFPIYVANLAANKLHELQIYLPLLIHRPNHWSIAVYILSCFKHFFFHLFNIALVQFSSKCPNDINQNIGSDCLLHRGMTSSRKSWKWGKLKRKLWDIWWNETYFRVSTEQTRK